MGFLERFQIDRDVRIESESSSLRNTLDIFTPVFLGIAFIHGFTISNASDMKTAFIFLLWIAAAVWLQRLPAALMAALKTRRKDWGAVKVQLSLYGVAIACVNYLLPLASWLLSNKLARPMMMVVLFVDLVMQAYLTVLLWQMNRTVDARPTG